tara:strand:+ start:239 stop:463 length:225 start_codon:yes stop_codon:yes gene_type:complete
MVDQARTLGVNGRIIQHGLTESMRDAAQRAVDVSFKVVGFDATVENPTILKIERPNYLPSKPVLKQACRDNENF